MNFFNFALCSPSKPGTLDGEVESAALDENVRALPCRTQSGEAGPPTLLHSNSGQVVKASTAPILVKAAGSRSMHSERGWCGTDCHDHSSPGRDESVKAPEADGTVPVPDDVKSLQGQKAQAETPPEAAEAPAPAEEAAAAAEDFEAPAAPDSAGKRQVSGAAEEEGAEEPVEEVDAPAEAAPEPEEDDAEKMRRLLEEELKAARQRIEEAMAERQRVVEEAEAMRKANQADTEKSRRLEEQLAAERRRAEAEADRRRSLEERIEAERLRKEQAAEARELTWMREEEEAQRVYEEAVAAAHRRMEEEKRRTLAAEEARRAAEEAARIERARLEKEALQRSSDAREEREMKEKVKMFLAEHGYRHVRAKCNRRTLAMTYPLHCAVYLNDTTMVRLLLRIGADSGAKNTWGQTPHRYAQWRNRKGSHQEILDLLAPTPAGAAAPAQ